MNELKRCPFCAGEAITERKDRIVFVECKQCLSRSSVVEIPSHIDEQDLHLSYFTGIVGEKWNHRVELIDKMQESIKSGNPNIVSGRW